MHSSELPFRYGFPLRLEFPGAVYNSTARGKARQPIVAADADRQRFVDALAREVGQQNWHCYAWCLVNNHYHRLMETPEGDLVTATEVRGRV